MTLLTLVRLRVRLRGRTATHMVSMVKVPPIGVVETEAYGLKQTILSQCPD